MNDDLISLKALIAEYDRVHIGPPGGARKLMEDAPAVDAVPIDSEFEQVLICAERYACGRQTYMPHTVIRYITPLLPHLDDNTLHVLDRDMQEAVRIGGLGDPQIDAPEWMAFHECVRDERKRRVENSV